ncbi:MAG: putative dsRNA-binding protein, partial [Candidatus Eremiobacterota bacterium]
DYKTLLQEISQSRYHCLPIYKVTEELGPEHEKTFHITVYVNNILMGNGLGKTKKEAGQLAAQEAIKKLKALCEGND